MEDEGDVGFHEYINGVNAIDCKSNAGIFRSSTAVHVKLLLSMEGNSTDATNFKVCSAFILVCGLMIFDAIEITADKTGKMVTVTEAEEDLARLLLSLTFTENCSVAI
jgi:hypothetical protein